MSAHFKGDVHFASPKNNDRVAWITKQMGFLQRFGVNFTLRLEGFSQLIQIDFVVLHLIARCKSLTTHKWQAAIKGQVAALTIHMSTLARARAFSLGTATGSFALPGGNTTPNTFSILFRARIGHKIV